ncbi:c-type cytochrome [Pseudolysobacter antarcticus]|nr:c-type cytochrome [Pseudolysobacter antarcticus]
MNFRFAWLAPLLAVLSLPTFAASAATDFVDLRHATAIHGDAAAGEAKVAVCSACHGAQGNAVVPQFPVLAGQRAEYIYQALRGFQRRADPASPMTPQVKDLSDSDLRNIAAYFSAAARHAAVPATVDAQLANDGERLFLVGDPTRGIPPCQGCHGLHADGHALSDRAAFYRLFPVLRGQHADYIAARLASYRDDKTHDTSNARIMRGVVQNIDDASAKAIAAWLSQLSE